MYTKYSGIIYFWAMFIWNPCLKGDINLTKKGSISTTFGFKLEASMMCHVQNRHVTEMTKYV